MKKFTLLLTSIFIISACSKSDNQNQTETPDAPTSLVEYVWHKAGSDFSADNLAMLIRSWNGMIDDAMCSGMTGANILTPEVSNEGYSEADLDAFRDDIAATNWSDTYWYGLLDPKFEPADPAPDFVWLNLWANSAEKEIAQNNYNNSDLPSTTGAAFTCNNFDFSGVKIRR